VRACCVWARRPETHVGVAQPLSSFLRRELTPRRHNSDESSLKFCETSFPASSLEVFFIKIDWKNLNRSTLDMCEIINIINIYGFSRKSWIFFQNGVSIKMLANQSSANFARNRRTRCLSCLKITPNNFVQITGQTQDTSFSLKISSRDIKYWMPLYEKSYHRCDK